MCHMIMFILFASLEIWKHLQILHFNEKHIKQTYLLSYLQLHELLLFPFSEYKISLTVSREREDIRNTLENSHVQMYIHLCTCT